MHIYIEKKEKNESEHRVVQLQLVNRSCHFDHQQKIIAHVAVQMLEMPLLTNLILLKVSLTFNTASIEDKITIL